jgi:sulfur relay protein TusB/DsrH
VKYLHIIKDPTETLAWEVAEAQAAEGHEVAVLLWQDGVLASRETLLPTWATGADLKARGIRAGRFKAVDYREVVELIFQVDRVTAW